MSPESFIYWLNGFMEIADPKSLDEKQLQVIKDHIALVLKKETPYRKSDKTEFSIPLVGDPSLKPGEIKIVPQLPSFPSSPSTISLSSCLRTGQPKIICTCFDCRNSPLIATC